MTNKLTRYLIFSQVSFFILIAVCIALIPKFLFSSNQGGLSNYGVHALTVIPFSLAFLISATFILLAAHELPGTEKRGKQLKFVFGSLAILLLFIMVSTYPYKINSTFDNIHLIAGFMMFIFQTAVAVWIAFTFHNDRLNILLLGLQGVGFIAGLLTLAGFAHLLFAVQLLTGLSFGGLLIRCVKTT